jgi:hypothetical protein
LKHLTEELPKNELLIFNQKGMDFLFFWNRRLRSRPFYRLVLSGSPLSSSARRFAIQWGIIVVEPQRIPLVTLHWLSGSTLPSASPADRRLADELWDEIPVLISPFQRRLQRLSQSFDDDAEVISASRIERVLTLQEEIGDKYFTFLDRHYPTWIEDKYDVLNRAINLSGRAS